MASRPLQPTSGNVPVILSRDHPKLTQCSPGTGNLTEIAPYSKELNFTDVSLSHFTADHFYFVCSLHFYFLNDIFAPAHCIIG